MGKTKVLIILAVLAWFLIAVLGLGYLAHYSNVDGGQGNVRMQWPKSVAYLFEPNKHNLLLFVHPRCSCSMATLRELEKLLPSLGDASVKVAFYRAPDEDDGWIQSRNFDFARGLANVETIIDPSGQLAEIFGANTSGHALLYTPKKSLVFSGGITPERGHEGDSEGGRMIRDFMALHQTATYPFSKVFGCALSKLANNEATHGQM